MNSKNNYIKNYNIIKNVRCLFDLVCLGSCHFVNNDDCKNGDEN